MRKVMGALAREPLLHFLAIGGLLYGLDAATTAPAENARRLVADAAVQGELVTAFAGSKGRAPTRDELDALVDTWLLNEVLFRQGKAMALDEGDSMIRERVIHKSRVLLQNGIVVEEPTEEELRAYFAQRTARYDVPSILDVYQVRVPDEAEAGRLAAAYREAAARGDGVSAPGEGVVGYLERPRTNIVQLFGEPFTARLESLPVGTWHAMASPHGWHVAMLKRLQPARPADFESSRARLVRDWKADRGRQLMRDAVAELEGDFEVVRLSLDPATLIDEAGIAAAANRSGEEDSRLRRDAGPLPAAPIPRAPAAAAPATPEAALPAGAAPGGGA